MCFSLEENDVIVVVLGGCREFFASVPSASDKRGALHAIESFIIHVQVWGIEIHRSNFFCISIYDHALLVFIIYRQVVAGFEIENREMLHYCQL